MFTRQCLIGLFSPERERERSDFARLRRAVDEAFKWLKRACAQRDGGFSEMKGDPLLKNLEGDPRYSAFLRKLRLPV